MSSDHPNSVILEIGLDPPDLGTNPWINFIFQVFFSVVSDEDDAVYREILKIFCKWNKNPMKFLSFFSIIGKFFDGYVGIDCMSHVVWPCDDPFERPSIVIESYKTSGRIKND